MNNPVLRILVAGVIWWYSMAVAIEYSGIWDSQAKPRTGVEVSFSATQHITGTLTRDWQNSYVLASSDGKKVHFKDFQMMTSPIPSQSNLLEHWRLLILPVFVSSLFMLVLISPFVRNRRQ